MICALLVFGRSAIGADWVYVPIESELQKGDIILTKSNGYIAPIIEGLGEYWNHVVMVTDPTPGNITMRDCYVTDDEINDTEERRDHRIRVTVDWGSLGETLIHAYHTDLPVGLNSVKLSNLKPGMQTLTGDELIKKSKKTDRNFARLTTRTEANKEILANIAEEMKKLDGYYILHAYVKMLNYEPVSVLNPDAVANVIGTGSHCSGAVWWAAHNAGIDLNIGVDDDTELISMLAEAMFTNLAALIKKKIEDEVDEKADEKLDESPALGWAIRQVRDKAKRHLIHNEKMHEKMANQVINTFLFNKSEDQTDYWRVHVSEVVREAMSPDQLLMVGIPNPDGNFTGIQTYSPYDAIEDYTDYSKLTDANGEPVSGYYMKYTRGDESDEVPVDPRTGEPPQMVLYSQMKDILFKDNPACDEISFAEDFEIIPIPEEYGGRLSRTLRFYITNQTPYTPLQLLGTAPVSVFGDDEISVACQPAGIVNPYERSTFDVNFSFDPAYPGDYLAMVSIPNNDPARSDYHMSLKLRGVNKSYFTDIPIYYNQCDDSDDFSNPLIGAQFGSLMTERNRGDAAGLRYIAARFGTGLQVWNRNKTDECYQWARIHPFSDTFTEDKPDLSRGTCAFWASANGEWSHEGDDDTDVYGEVNFYLTDTTYFRMHASSGGHVASVQFYVQGRPIVGTMNIPKKEFASIIVQWDLLEGFPDGTNMRFYCNGNLYGSRATVSPADINNFMQNFYLISRTNNGGDERPDHDGYGCIDNIIFWNKIVNPASILSINGPKRTIE